MREVKAKRLVVSDDRQTMARVERTLASGPVTLSSATGAEIELPPELAGLIADIAYTLAGGRGVQVRTIGQRMGIEEIAAETQTTADAVRALVQGAGISVSPNALLGDTVAVRDAALLIDAIEADRRDALDEVSSAHGDAS